MEPLVSLYTETLQQLLLNQRYGEEDQSSSLTEILTIMNYFPSFEVESNVELDFEDLFIQKYDIREIGAETEELFMHHWREKANELLIKYKYKIEMWAKRFNELFDFKISLNIQKFKENIRNEETNKEGTDKTSNTYYLNPVNTNTTNLKVQDVDNSDTNSNINAQSNINATQSENNILEVPQAVWGKTRPYIMEQILNLKDIYLDCLDEFEDLFMGLY